MHCGDAEAAALRLAARSPAHAWPPRAPYATRARETMCSGLPTLGCRPPGTVRARIDLCHSLALARNVASTLLGACPRRTHTRASPVPPPRAACPKQC